MLNVGESFELLKKNGVDGIADFKLVKSEKDMDFSFPFWLKANIAGHKVEKRAVLKCNNLIEAKKNLGELKKNFEDIIIQKSYDGIEMIIGIKKDSVFGKLLMIGFGGTFTEVIKDVSFRAMPVNKKEIVKMIDELKFRDILFSRKKYAVDEFVELAEKISKLGVEEADFNPVILNEQGAWIVDARIKND